MQAILQLPVQSNPAAPCKSLSTAPNLDASCFNLSQSWPNIVMGHCLIKAAQDLLHPLEPCLQASLLQHVLQVVTPALQMVAVLGGCHRMRCGCQLLRRVACAVGRAMVLFFKLQYKQAWIRVPARLQRRWQHRGCQSARPHCRAGGMQCQKAICRAADLMTAHRLPGAPCHDAEQGAPSCVKHQPGQAVGLKPLHAGACRAHPISLKDTNLPVLLEMPSRNT